LTARWFTFHLFGEAQSPYNGGMERAVYRIIDANFNRGREALRVMEDVCRFYLNSLSLSSRAKHLRHELSSAIAVLDSGQLLTSRDTPGDVGTTITVENQLSRGDLRDCLTAAAKRASEALRTLSEVAQTIDPALAARIEKVRYACYTLEKDIVLAVAVRPKMAAVRLYVVITSSAAAEIISLARRCCQGGAQCIQLRAKSLADVQLLAVAGEFAGVCREHGIISIINDRVDIAAACGADGVHLGQDDLPIRAARKLELSPLVVGRSTHNVNQLRAAIEDGADYVGIGPVFATETKPDIEVAGLEYVRQAAPIAAEAGILGVAIGGITLGNISQVMGAGAAAVAVCGAVAGAPDPAAACKSFVSRLLEKNP
jgi:thiamine-phosphate pyrophosphorylase